MEAPALRLRRSRVGRHGCLRGGPATTPALWLWLFTASPGADELQPATIQAHREDQALTGAQFKNHTGALRWVAVWTRSSGILVLSRGPFRCPKLSSKVLSRGDKSSLFVPSSGPWKIRLTSNKEVGLGEWSFLSQSFARPLAWVGAGVGARAAKRLETQRELSSSVNSPSVAASWLFHQGLGRSPVPGPIELANPVGKSPLMLTDLSCVSGCLFLTGSHAAQGGDGT